MGQRRLPEFRVIKAGRERLAPGHDMPRHRHLDAYCLVVVGGAIEQISYSGRFVVRAGEMLVQPTLDCHANTMISNGAEVLRLYWPREASLGGLCRLDDLDAMVRVAERDATLAAHMARDCVARCGMSAGALRDWPDALAADLAHGRAPRIAHWAYAHGLSREAVARGFARAYGAGPARIRSELRAREAWLRATGSKAPLSTIAADLGFSDQAHMTRSVVALTGAAPSFWRRTQVPRLPARGSAAS
jgi:AraC-like DNA-binding protein